MTSQSGPVIARRRQFSTAHFYEQKAFTPEKNRDVFGACYTPHGHGHNYTLEIFVEGPIDPETGLVVNVTDLDIILKQVCSPFDHHHISFDVPAFKDIVPTTEHLISYFFTHVKTELSKLHPGLSLNRIRLFETDEIWAEARAEARAEERVQTSPASPAAKLQFELTRQIVIRSIHHLENKSWSPEQNRELYGICYGTHGHHYKVQVTCKGVLDLKTGLILDRDQLDRILEAEIRTKYDGVDLNKRFANTSCEALAIEFYKLLENKLPTASLVRVGIQETRKNYFEFPPQRS